MGDWLAFPEQSLGNLVLTSYPLTLPAGYTQTEAQCPLLVLASGSPRSWHAYSAVCQARRSAREQALLVLSAL